MRDLVARLGHLLFPPSCIFCHRPVPFGEVGCPTCLREIHPLNQNRLCPRCALPLPDGAQPGACGTCMRKPPSHQRAVALFSYEKSVRSAILNWKHSGEDRAILWLLDTAKGRLRAAITPDDLLVPIPMPLSRMRRSGYHHAAELCRMVATITGCRWTWRWLRRRGEQPRQSSLTRKERQRSLRNAFTLDARHQPSLAPESTIWLVDDIMTTGATLDGAAKIVKRAGRPASALALARTLRKR